MDTISFIETTSPWFFPLVVFIFGACIGSFLNVCIIRLPKGESILWPPSHSATGRRLSWWENIPILAWIYLRGRDRETGQKYGIRYPAIELLTAVLFVVCWLRFEPLMALVGMVFVSILIVCTFIDIEHMVLPDSFTVGGMLCGVLISFWIPEMHIDPDKTRYISNGLASGMISIISALLGAGLVFWVGEIGEIVFRKPAMGLGDAKLIGCVGAFCGWQGAVFSLFGGAIIGCVLLIPVMIIQRLIPRKETKSAETSSEPEEAELEDNRIGFGLEIPFGPMLALGAAIYFLGIGPWVNSYFSLVREMIFS